MQIYPASRAVDRDPITDKSRDWKSNANVSSCQIVASPITGRHWGKKKNHSSLTSKQIHGRVFTHVMQKFMWQSRMIEWKTERLADPLLAVLDRSVVATATGSPGLVFRAVGEQRILCWAHIWEVSSHGAVVFALHPFYFRLIPSSGVIISQINRSCLSAQQPLNRAEFEIFVTYLSRLNSFHNNNNYTGAEDVGMVLSLFCMIS